MVKNRKAFVFILSLSLLAAAVLTVLSMDTGKEKQSNGKMLIYTSLFPLYDFAKQIGGPYVEVHSIVPPGAEPHDFEPSPRDMARLNDARVFIYNGAGYEVWIQKARKNIDPNHTILVDASQGIPLLSGVSEEAGASPSGYNRAASNAMPDPHMWLNPLNAKHQAETIEKALIQADPLHKAAYKANYDKLAADLVALDQEYTQDAGKAKKKEFVTSHRAFAYMAKRYGLTQIAVSGISPSDEPSQQALEDLINVVKQHNIHYVTFEELAQSKIAETVQREAGAQAIVLNPLENVTKEEMAEGKSYIQLMKQNLGTLKKVLEINE
jgi:zinc transport system substrate-binding protein